MTDIYNNPYICKTFLAIFAQRIEQLLNKNAKRIEHFLSKILA